MKNYILITPVKNEVDNLVAVIDSVFNQKIKPVVWIIVDDGSDDGSEFLISDLEKNNNWIKIIRLPVHERDITFHYSYVCKKGFDFAIDYCQINNINYDYISLLDSDTVVTENYYLDLLGIMEDDSKLGIISGGIYHKINDLLVFNNTNLNRPAGTGRIWRKKCFFDTGGYKIEPSPDSISNVKALLQGWKIGKCENIIAIERRQTSSADGLWRGYRIKGRTDYYLNKNPALIVFSAINFIKTKPYYHAIPYVIGYIDAFVNQKGKIDDEEIRNYFHYTRIMEYLCK